MYCFFFQFSEWFWFSVQQFLLLNVIHLIHLSLPNLCFYTIIRSLIILKVLIRQISECLLKPKLIIIINLLMLAKLLDFLAINHSLFERRGIFIPWLLKLSHVLDTLQLAWACTFLHLSWIMWFSLVPFPGCQGSCGIFPNGLTYLVIFFNMRQGLKC